MVAKKLDGESTIYNADNFLKNNIIMTSNSKPALNEEGYFMKRSIVGSIECFERYVKQNNFIGHSQSVKMKELRGSQSKTVYKSHINHNIKPVTIEYYGIQEINKAQEREKKGLLKYENTVVRKKGKIEELKKQSLKRMKKRGARGYVILDDKSTKGTTQNDESMEYKEAQTASIYFHNTDERKFQRGDKIELKAQDINILKNKMLNREKKSKIRSQLRDAKLDSKTKLVNLKGKRHLDLYNKRSREWRNQELKTAKKLHRTKSQSLYSAIDNYRNKIEQKELAEKIAPLNEKYGENRLWKMNLRRKEYVEARVFKYEKGNLIENN
jgi:hypothetical protein